MGNTQAIGMAEAVREHQVSLYPAIHYHLTANHFPPVGEYTDLLVEVIDAVNSGTCAIDSVISLGLSTYKMLPSRAYFDYAKGEWAVQVGDLIEATHAWAFLVEMGE